MESFATNFAAMQTLVEKHYLNNDIEAFKAGIADMKCSDRKAPVDQAFREHLKILVAAEADTEELRALLDFSVSCALADACSQFVPFLLFADAYDSATIPRCQEIFELMEDRVAIIKQGPLYRSGKTALLRMCNDLLRRLSKSQDTVFCGRILLFLARLFPLDEKSGLNLMSNFNSELGPPPYSFQSDKLASSQQALDISNENGVADDSDAFQSRGGLLKPELMDVAIEATMTTDVNSLQVDFSLYTKFWSLQETLRNPNLCYEKQHWLQFTGNTVDVLSTFAAFKLDDAPQHSSKESAESAATVKNEDKKLGTATAVEGEIFFAKYLTSEKLLDLQLMDGHFRRYIFCQLLILFQYLNASIKFKTPEQVLTEEQASWVKQHTEKVHQLICETPPNGSEFLKFVLHALHREEFWSTWKNDGCQTFIRTNIASTGQQATVAARKRRANPLLDREGHKIFRFAHTELNRLWNLCPDNFEAARNRERRYTPSVMSYFAEAIEQADPAQCVEEEFKHVNNEGWNWRALRLMARRSSQFFASSTVPGRKLRDYMDNIVKRAAASRPMSTTPLSSKMEDCETPTAAMDADNDNESASASASQPPSPTSGATETNNADNAVDD